ncbi:MAG: hypothetical protein OXH96_18800 [Spirochaetaceae bacterium]|nr:hypothetical protein [Spirochaetaceae bacterium]
MKQFVFDRLVDPDNLCNLQREQQVLEDAVRRRYRMVVYGPRNYGKTSVVRNITIENFLRNRGRRFVLFADLLGVRSMQSLTRRLATSLQRSFAASFPVRSLLEDASRFLGALRPEIALDPQTGSPSLSLHTRQPESVRDLQALWEHIAGITGEVDSLIVLDEFQDVAFIDEAPAQLRSCLETLGDVPILLLGSKRHMLADLFAAPDAPLGAWGTDLEFRPIPHDEYHRYIEERFRPRRLTIPREVAAWLQDEMQRVPEAINRLCAQLLELHQATGIDQAMVRAALVKLLENREGRFAAYLSAFSATDESVLTEIARRETVAHPQSKDFLASVGLSNRTVALSVRRLWDRGVIEQVAGSYRIADPLLAAYLRRYR